MSAHPFGDPNQGPMAVALRGRDRFCACCGADFVIDPANVGGTGYAILLSGPFTNRRACYACADALEVADLGSVTRYTGYLSGDGQRFTTWTGGLLGDVIASRPCRLTRPSFTHDRQSYRTVRVRDVYGHVWYGRGSPGLVINLRRAKEH